MNLRNIITEYNEIRRGLDSSISEFSLLNRGFNYNYRIQGRKATNK